MLASKRRESSNGLGFIREGFIGEAVLKMTAVESKVIPGGRQRKTKDAEAGMLPKGEVVSARARESSGR